jgi:C4-dicarboxylate-specific signal transduction histidine kinase
LQICLNLALNAQQALTSRKVRTFSISAEREGEWVRVDFSNPGPKISNAAGLFTAKMPGAKGDGLGLYVSKSIALANGGELSYLFEGGQNRFRLLLPVSALRPAAIAPRREERQDFAGTNRRRADDRNEWQEAHPYSG